jgi:hypothetical protein
MLLLSSCLLLATAFLAPTTSALSTAAFHSKEILLKANARSKHRLSQLAIDTKSSIRTPYPLPAAIIDPQQCMGVPLTMCVGSEDTSSMKLYAPNAKPKSLTSWYNFDDALGYDNAMSTSGGRNGGDGGSRFLVPSSPNAPIKFAPGYGGVGGSIRFDGGKDDWVQVPSTSNNDDEMTVSFWMFLRNKPISSYNFILRKGSEKIEFTPTIQITNKRKLHVRLRQINDENAHGHSFQSFGRIPFEKWTHVALVLQAEVARVYLNGVRDNMIVLNDRYRVNREAWYLGGMPGKPGVNAFVDDFKVHNEGLAEGQIQAMCHGALGVMSARNIRFLDGGKWWLILRGGWQKKKKYVWQWISWVCGCGHSFFFFSLLVFDSVCRYATKMSQKCQMWGRLACLYQARTKGWCTSSCSGQWHVFGPGR